MHFRISCHFRHVKIEVHVISEFDRRTTFVSGVEIDMCSSYLGIVDKIICVFCTLFVYHILYIILYNCILYYLYVYYIIVYLYIMLYIRLFAYSCMYVCTYAGMPWCI